MNLEGYEWINKTERVLNMAYHHGWLTAAERAQIMANIHELKEGMYELIQDDSQGTGETILRRESRDET